MLDSLRSLKKRWKLDVNMGGHSEFSDEMEREGLDPALEVKVIAAFGDMVSR